MIVLRCLVLLPALAALPYCLCHCNCLATSKEPDHPAQHVTAGKRPATTSTRQERASPADTALAITTRALRSNAIPPWVFRLTQLRQLSIGGMDCDYRGGPPCWAIRDIPPAIAQLQQLRVLALTVNSIGRLPAALGQLPHLRSLNLTDNPGLTDIAPLVNAASLAELTLNGCGLSQLPADIGQLAKLKKLGLIGNPLAPAELARVRKALPHCEVSF